ncbi:MAG: hypothetical protein ACRD3D_12300 [Terriglobia bacterium]
MKTTIAKYALGAGVIVLFAAGALFAKGERISIMYRGEVGTNLVLAPGTYKMVVNTSAATPEASFYNHNDLVGTTPVKVVAKSQKNDQTEVFYSTPQNNVRQITEIDVNGKRDRLIFPKS